MEDNNERPATRVTALDAVDLDSEIQRIFKEQVLKIVHTLSPSFLKWEPELDTALRLVLWKMSVWRLHATFGQQLLNLKYSSKQGTHHRTIAWALLSVCASYVKQRTPLLASLLVHPSYSDKVTQVMDWLDTCTQFATLLNLLVFLREGKFPTVADRIVGLKPVTTAPTGRVLGYSFMTRELLWHGFIELLVFMLPLVNYKYLCRVGRHLIGLKGTTNSKLQPLVYTVATKCAVCQHPPVLPHHFGCPHAFCYYCLTTNQMADSKFECPSCGQSARDPESVQPVTSQICSY